jgi:transposase
MGDIVARIEVVSTELRQLREWGICATARRRASILLSYVRLRSQRAVARALGRARSTVQSALDSFECFGIAGLFDRRHGRRRIYDRPVLLAFLRTLVASAPSDRGWARTTWTAELVAHEVLAELRLSLSRCHIGRLLREAGCRRRKPKQTIARAPADKHEQKAKLDAVLAKVGPSDIVLYADEMDVHLNPKIGPDWMPPGVRKPVVTPGKNAKHYVAGALCPRTRRLIFVDGTRKNSALFIALLHRLVEVLGENVVIHLVVDNYIIHDSRVTRKAIDKLDGRVILHFLPPYCPDFNPIERVWWDLHARVTRNHRHPSIDGLMVDVREYLVARDGRPGRDVPLRRTA